MVVCPPFLYDFLCSKHLRLLTVWVCDHIHFEGHLLVCFNGGTFLLRRSTVFFFVTVWVFWELHLSGYFNGCRDQCSSMGQEGGLLIINLIFLLWIAAAICLCNEVQCVLYGSLSLQFVVSNASIYGKTVVYYWAKTCSFYKFPRRLSWLFEIAFKSVFCQ